MAILEVKISSSNEKGRGRITIGKDWLELYSSIGKTTKRIKIDVKELKKYIDGLDTLFLYRPKFIYGRGDIIKNKCSDVELVAFPKGTLKAIIWWLNPKDNVKNGGYTLKFSIEEVKKSLALLLLN